MITFQTTRERTLYVCTCGNEVELRISADEVICVRCKRAMKPVQSTLIAHRGRYPLGPQSARHRNS